MFKKIANDIFTGKDNITYDCGRLLTFIFSIAYTIYPFIEMSHGHPFSDQSWAIGAAAIMSGSGALLFLKKDTEPT